MWAPVDYSSEDEPQGINCTSAPPPLTLFPTIPPIIPGGGDSGFGYGTQLTRVEVNVEPE